MHQSDVDPLLWAGRFSVTDTTVLLLWLAHWGGKIRTATQFNILTC